jgi:hypothetical protein
VRVSGTQAAPCCIKADAPAAFLGMRARTQQPFAGRGHDGIRRHTPAHVLPAPRPESDGVRGFLSLEPHADANPLRIKLVRSASMPPHWGAAFQPQRSTRPAGGERGGHKRQKPGSGLAGSAA